MSSQRIIVTAALPYANGSLHLGHLVEYCQTDMYVRALKRLGTDALFICANDAHGTPIEVNAGRLGVTPEALVQRVHAEQQADFAKFDVEFDHFSITHSDTNRRVVEEVYRRLRQDGHLEDRDVDGNWCETDQRFLPDRYVKGTCPYCKTADQYGDVCESCRRTYTPVDLEAAQCILCGNPPSRRTSRHVFFRLSAPEHTDFVKGWIDSGALQADQANYIRSWFDKGIQDWCISRDGPYFGFSIPDRPDKFFYVWLDAPLGYISSSIEWGETHGATFADLWTQQNCRIEHIIGKDIVYFHTLFWPAVLHAVGYSIPDKVHVHGMLTIDGHKMSKTRGTFINADVFASHVEPQALRYYYACKFGAGTEDLDLAFDDFVQRVNAELVNKHANLFSRAAQFLLTKLDGRLGDLPFTPEQAQANPGSGAADSVLELARQVVAHCRAIEAHYRSRELGHAIRELCAIADIGNEYMQGRAPWAQLKAGDEAAARETCTFALNVCHALVAYMWPIVPRFCDAGARVLGVEIERMNSADLFKQRNRSIGKMERLFERLERKAIDAIIEASKQSVPGGGGARAKNKLPAGLVTFDEFKRLELRAGIVRSAERLPKSKKLLCLQVDIGEETPRQVVAGLAHVYAPEDLLNTGVVLVVNLQPAKLMGVESHGMLLAAGEGDDIAVLRLDRPLPPGTLVR